MFAFLLSPITRYAAIGLAILAAVTGIYLKGRSDGKETMRPKLEAAQSEADLWQKTAQNRASLIEAQNQAVASLKQKYDTELADMNKRLTAVNLEGRKIREAAEKRANTILGMSLPKNECEAMAELIDEARK